MNNTTNTANTATNNNDPIAINATNSSSSSSNINTIIKKSIFTFETNNARGRSRLVIKPLTVFSDKEFQQVARNAIKKNLPALVKERTEDKMKEKVIEIVEEKMKRRKNRVHFGELNAEFGQFKEAIIKFPHLKRQLMAFSKKSDPSASPNEDDDVYTQVVLSPPSINQPVILQQTLATFDNSTSTHNNTNNTAQNTVRTTYVPPLMLTTTTASQASPNQTLMLPIPTMQLITPTTVLNPQSQLPPLASVIPWYNYYSPRSSTL